MPEIIKIEPLEWRAQAEMLQPVRIGLHQFGKHRIALLARQMYRVAEAVEMNFRVAAGAHREQQVDRTLQQARQHVGADRKWRFRAQKKREADTRSGRHRNAVASDHDDLAA